MGPKSANYMGVIPDHHTSQIDTFSENCIVYSSFRNILFFSVRLFSRQGLNLWTQLRAGFLLVLIMMMSCKLDEEEWSQSRKVETMAGIAGSYNEI